MNGHLDLPDLLLAVLGGVALAGVFFLGLWLTVRNLHKSLLAQCLIVPGFIVRAAIVLAGISWLSAGDWRGLLGCLFGFFIGRFLMVRMVVHSFDVEPQSQGVSTR